jgi:hypothetical protein
MARLFPTRAVIIPHRMETAMGWLYMKSLKGHSGLRQYLDAQFTHERPDVISKGL